MGRNSRHININDYDFVFIYSYVVVMRTVTNLLFPILAFTCFGEKWY